MEFFTGLPLHISIHALREEGDARERDDIMPISEFLSTPSARRATSQHPAPRRGIMNFYPRPPRGGRPADQRPQRRRFEISIHALREEGDAICAISPAWPSTYFYPRPPRGGRLVQSFLQMHLSGISIHALREEGDAALLGCPGVQNIISIHALREEGDGVVVIDCTIHFAVFLSTPSARRATRGHFISPPTAFNFYPRPPRGGRPAPLPRQQSGDYTFLSTPSARRATSASVDDAFSDFISIHALREEGDLLHLPPLGGLGIISIHALREEGDAARNSHVQLIALFLSTPSARRATVPTPGTPPGNNEFLSTPSARRATAGKVARSPQSLHFYPRPPRGGRPVSFPYVVSHTRDFYPRPPRGGRRRAGRYAGHSAEISIHALREEGDVAVFDGFVGAIQFLSTPSARRATRTCLALSGLFPISIHALREEGDHLLLLFPSQRTDFYPRPPRGGRHRSLRLSGFSGQISIHALREEGDAMQA